MNVLIIEDEKDIAELIRYNLQKEKIEAEIHSKGQPAILAARKSSPDLIILDLMLPDMDGLDVCKILKSDPKTKEIPILMLTAKSTEIDRIVGFEVGADDYLTKPFSPRELILRIKAIGRRFKENKSDSDAAHYAFGLLDVDPSKYRVMVGSKEIKLTAIEFKLLQFLLKTKGHVATRDILLDQVWGYDAALTTRTVDTHIKRLREKLGKAGDYIETLRGVGYRLREKPN